jgi:hypothetical protein
LFSLHHLPLPAGKTNNGIHLFGRAMRHLDVLLCPIGALALYLFVRFNHSQEFNPPPNFSSNQEWFDVKLYTDGSMTKAKTGITTKSYASAMSIVAKALGVSSKHTTHLGRVLGPKVLEMLEFDQDEIRVLGNWDPKIQESTYSTKVPMKVLRGMAGFDEAGGMHYNPRTAVDVDNELRDAVFPWVRNSIIDLDKYESEMGVLKPTARQFLNHMNLMQTVLIQDVAAMMLLHPDRCTDDYPLFKNCSVWKTDLFLVSCCVCCFLLLQHND